MIGILLVWFIIGIILVILSGFLYMDNIIGFEILIVTFLVGLGIIIAMVWQTKRNEPEKIFSSLKNIFKTFSIISIIIFLMGALGYSLIALSMLDSESESITMELLIIGSFIFVISLISYLYVEMILPIMISRKISEQERALTKIKEEHEAIGTSIKSLDNDMKKIIDDSIKTSDKNKDALLGR